MKKSKVKQKIVQKGNQRQTLFPLSPLYIHWTCQYISYICDRHKFLLEKGTHTVCNMYKIYNLTKVTLSHYQPHIAFLKPLINELTKP